MAFDDRLVDALRAAGNRDTAPRFAEYAGMVAEAPADRVARWIPGHEPMVETCPTG